VAIGIGAVALLAFLGSAVANQSQKGPDFWFTAILDTLISITKSKIVQRIAAYLNPKTFGPAVEAAVDFIAILLEDALRGLRQEILTIGRPETN
jgi:DNA-binding Lrp family transcriptional regulator